MGRRKRWSEERRREDLEAQARSSLSLRAFADRKGFPYTTLHCYRSVDPTPLRRAWARVGGGPSFGAGWRPKGAG